MPQILRLIEVLGQELEISEGYLQRSRVRASSPEGGRGAESFPPAGGIKKEIPKQIIDTIERLCLEVTTSPRSDLAWEGEAKRLSVCK